MIPGDAHSARAWQYLRIVRLQVRILVVLGVEVKLVVLRRFLIATMLALTSGAIFLAQDYTETVCDEQDANGACLAYSCLNGK